MGIYSDYLNSKMSFEELTKKRKEQLAAIAKIRDDRDIIVYASDINNKANAPVGIDFSDILPFQDQLSNLKGKSIDVILETPGGIAEAVEDMVRLLRSRYDHIGIIIPGTAKSAGTIFTMAGDEILMGPASSLGPIDAQIIMSNKRFSADAFLEGLEKIKEDVLKTGKLNPAYIPILQNISPGEIQHCENAQSFSKTLVTQWLSNYKFKYWETHSSTSQPVTLQEKETRAKEIADKLCKHSDWLTHGRSIPITELEKMGLKITNYSINPQLNEAITRYYTLLKMSLETSNIYKIFETTTTQVLRFAVPNAPSPSANNNQHANNAIVNIECPSCKQKYEMQLRLTSSTPVEPSKIQYPKNDKFICPNCKMNINLAPLRLQIESQTGKKVIS
ncbi:SDH family Clp fold serine proteinase [Terrimonas alba]|uniref:SDH family Clp fold serine proteinase n=1 Tax=Terrimonas alba TaxID=3349636 RepID=UPI0035F25664